jgi:hypothetical protein
MDYRDLATDLLAIVCMILSVAIFNLNHRLGKLEGGLIVPKDKNA